MNFNNGNIIISKEDGSIYKLIYLNWDVAYYKTVDPRGWHKAQLLYHPNRSKGEVFLENIDLKKFKLLTL